MNYTNNLGYLTSVIEKHLNPDESVLWIDQPDRKKLVWFFVKGIGVTLIILALLFLTPLWKFTSGIVPAIFLGLYLRYRQLSHDVYAVTNKRILIVSKNILIFGKSTIESYDLEKVKKVTGEGSVIAGVVSRPNASDAFFFFHRISNSKTVIDLIRQHAHIS